jgi:hypothetical protein
MVTSVNVSGLINETQVNNQIDEVAVRHDVTQTITDAGKARARTNIGLGTAATASTVDAVTNGEMSPITSNAVFDGLALKIDTNNVDAAIDARTQSSVVDGDTRPVSGEAVHTALALKVNSSDAEELIRDTSGTALTAGKNVTIAVNDAGNTITIDAKGIISLVYPDAVVSAYDMASEIQTFLDLWGSTAPIKIYGTITLNSQVEIKYGWDVSFVGTVRPMSASFIIFRQYIGSSFIVENADLRIANVNGVNLTSYNNIVCKLDGSTHNAAGPASEQAIVSTKTFTDVRAVGTYNNTSSQGRAVNISAGTEESDSRVVGATVIARAFWVDCLSMVQAGGTNDRFINSNEIILYADSSKSALLMTDTTSGKTAVSANNIILHAQARAVQLTNDIPVVIDGQFNSFSGVLWDYEGGLSTTTAGVSLVSGANYNQGSITLNTSDTYHVDSSANNTNRFDYLNDGTRTITGATSVTLRAAGSDRFIVDSVGTTMPNNVPFRIRDASGTEHSIIYVGADNNTYFKSPALSGSLGIFDNLGGQFFRVNGVNAFSVDTNRHFTVYGFANTNPVLMRNFNTAPQSLDFCDVTGRMTVKMASVPTATFSAGAIGAWAADADFVYFYVSGAVGWKKTALIAI